VINLQYKEQIKIFIDQEISEDEIILIYAPVMSSFDTQQIIYEIKKSH